MFPHLQVAGPPCRVVSVLPPAAVELLDLAGVHQEAEDDGAVVLSLLHLPAGVDPGAQAPALEDGQET